ncbi:unnamed protein product [Phytophthora fragariaefolia]|uniref:Unnamed protein product n=1 Tax=Phytophthora fragariaefolia TaxID=1490495 RepID=A0A9W6XDJ8_9STRA|nr:unnamed protein product [Phytophthora fragariaefolia]
MDFVFGLPRDTQGRTGVLVFVDRFSKMLHLAPVAASITAKQTAAIFVDVVYRHHGLPSSIVSDRDPRFTSAFWRELFQLLGTRLCMSTASHPETDGQTERANRVVEDVLRSFATSFKSWSSFLPLVEFALNNAVHASTGLSPFFVNFGRHPRVPELLGVERSETPAGRAAEDAGDPVSLVRDEDVAVDPDPGQAERRGPAPDAVSALLHGVTTRQGSNAPAVGVRTRAATRAAHERPRANPERASRTRAARRAAPSDIAAWTSRTLIDPMPRRAIEYHDVQDAATPAAPVLANFDPLPAPQPQDTAAVRDFLQKRDPVVRYVRDTIAAAVDRQMEYADRRGRRHLETFAVGDRVLLSMTGIQTAAATNLGANKFTPRFIGPFKVTKVLGDAYTLQLPSAICLHPTFYVGRLRRYHPAVIPSDAGSSQRRSRLHGPVDQGAAADHAPPQSARPAVQPSRAPAAAAGPNAAAVAPPGLAAISRVAVDPVHDAAAAAQQRADVAAPPPRPPDGHAARFQRDGAAPLVDSAGNVRHIVEAILEHDDHHAAPRVALPPRGARDRDSHVPMHRQYLVRWLGPMPDSWEPREVLLEDVPDCVAAYEATLGGVASLRRGAAARRA